MKHILLNPNASSQQAAKKWQKVSNLFSDHQLTLIDKQHQLIIDLEEGDEVVCAGGDGTAHHFINQFIESKGLDKLQSIHFGFIGIGSNNSFLQPEKKAQPVGPFFGRYGHETHLRDLVEVTIRNESTLMKRYMVSNGSIGFLAMANDFYNRDLKLQPLKRTNHKLAELYAFSKTLIAFTPFEVSLSSDFINFAGSVYNINILKSPYYTRDLFFPREIPMNSGQFQGLLLEQVSKLSLVSRFLQAFLFKKMTAAFTTAWSGHSLKVDAKKPLPIEIDGEVYWGEGFEFKCLQQKLRVCA